VVVEVPFGLLTVVMVVETSLLSLLLLAPDGRAVGALSSGASTHPSPLRCQTYPGQGFPGAGKEVRLAGAPCISPCKISIWLG